MMQDCRTSCIYRIAQEGLPLLLPWMSKQVVHVRAETLLRQLTESSIALPETHRLPMEVSASPRHTLNIVPLDPLCPRGPAFGKLFTPIRDICSHSGHALGAGYTEFESSKLFVM